MKRIVIATDSSPGARAAVAHGLDLARRLGDSVTFVSVRPGAPLFGDPALIRRLCDELRETRAALEGAMREAQLLGVDADFEIAEGPVAEEIVRAAQYRDASLIVVGACSPGDLSDGTLGSVSQEVVEISPLPVVVVKRTRTGTPRIEAAGAIASV